MFDNVLQIIINSYN